MSNNSQQDNSNNQPLFQNVDAQERALAGDTDGDQIDRESVVGSEGRFETPTIPAQSSFGASANMPVPPTAMPDLLTNKADNDRPRD